MVLLVFASAVSIPTRTYRRRDPLPYGTGPENVCFRVPLAARPPVPSCGAMDSLTGARLELHF